MEQSPLRLFHGTSTLFLDSIIDHGLGGLNPIAEWGVLDFALAIFPVAKEKLGDDETWSAKLQTFGYMVGQVSSSMNFQHGETYLSPSTSTAIRYAIDQRYGSELLSYALDFLDELLRRDVPGVRDDLYHRFPKIFGMRDISCAPLVVEARDVLPTQLVSEHGEDAGPNIARVHQAIAESNQFTEIRLQQTNFRLTQPVPSSRLRYWLINVRRWDPCESEYTLHEIGLRLANGDLWQL